MAGKKKEEKGEVRRDLEPDGKWSPSDELEADPDFQDEYEDMVDNFFKESNPGLHGVLEKIKK